MIHLTRSRTEAAVPRGLHGSALIAKNAALIQAKLSGILDDPGKGFWRDKSVNWKAAKKQLKAETRGKCAYCESPADQVAHGDVDHFRPKSKYWWLAYCYDNYLYVCQICNQIYKSDNFDVAGQLMAEPLLPKSSKTLAPDALVKYALSLSPDPVNDSAQKARVTYWRQARKERPYLVDPYLADPERLFAWVADETLQEVTIQARGKSISSKRAFRAAEDHLGLNREELRRWRWVLAYEPLCENMMILKELDAAGITGSVRRRVVRAIHEMMAPNRPYAGMVRYFVNVKWNDELQSADVPRDGG